MSSLSHRRRARELPVVDWPSAFKIGTATAVMSIVFGLVVWLAIFAFAGLGIFAAALR